MYFNRTFENFRKVVHGGSNVEIPQTTEQLLPTKTNSIIETLNMLRSTAITPLNKVSEIQIEMCDFNEALKKIVPSSKREGFVTVPNVTWDDIGSLKKIRQELHMAMLVSIETLLLSVNDL